MLQIWKHKGEEFRLSGKGGVFWWSARFSEEEDYDLPPSIPPPKYTADEDVIDISSCFRSQESKFYPVENILKEQLGESLRTLDRLTSLRNPPEELAKSDSKTENAPVMLQSVAATTDVIENGQATDEEKAVMVNGTSEDEPDKTSDSSDLKSLSDNADVIMNEALKLEDLKIDTGAEKKELDAVKLPVNTAGIVNLNEPFKITYKPLLPKLICLPSDEDLLDFYRISQTDFFVLAMNAGLSEVSWVFWFYTL